MKTVYSPEHALQNPAYEFIRGQKVETFESPSRAELILRQVLQNDLGQVLAPDELRSDVLQRVHSQEFISFLEGFWAKWSAENGETDALPNTWVPPRVRRLATDRPGAELGRFCVDMSSAVQQGTWNAATSAAACAATGASLLIQGDKSAFALCRPPGHHAGWDFFGGYCFLNNAAVAAQTLRDAGRNRVAILDVDYHHGNGTQDIFFERSDVLTVSIHADPGMEYPYYCGYGDEIGNGNGEDCNLNLPLPFGTDWRAYELSLTKALDRIDQFGADALVVSLGVDTFKDDPISKFSLANDDYTPIGRHLSELGLQTLFVMEGGYAVEDIGLNTINVLSGFEGRI